MDQNIKILKLAKNCNFLEGLEFKDVNFCIKTRFLNAVLNRWSGSHTQKDVSTYLGISKRTVDSLEKGAVTNIVTVFNYIHFFGKDNAMEKQRQPQLNYFKNNKK